MLLQLAALFYYLHDELRAGGTKFLDILRTSPASLPFFAAMPPVAREALVVAFPEVHDPSAVEVHGALISTDAVSGRELGFCRWSDLAGPGARIGVLLLRHRRWRQQQWSSNERKDSGFHRRSNGRQPFLSMLSATELMATGMSPQQ